jgi:hypothetical protein
MVRVEGQWPGQDEEGGEAGQGHGDPGQGPAAGRPGVRRGRDGAGCRGAGGRCLGGAQGLALKDRGRGRAGAVVPGARPARTR